MPAGGPLSNAMQAHSHIASPARTSPFVLVATCMRAWSPSRAEMQRTRTNKRIESPYASSHSFSSWQHFLVYVCVCVMPQAMQSIVSLSLSLARSSLLYCMHALHCFFFFATSWLWLSEPWDGFRLSRSAWTGAGMSECALEAGPRPTKAVSRFLLRMPAPWPYACSCIRLFTFTSVGCHPLLALMRCHWDTWPKKKKKKLMPCDWELKAKKEEPRSSCCARNNRPYLFYYRRARSSLHCVFSCEGHALYIVWVV